jgi:hypothetical protein
MFNLKEQRKPQILTHFVEHLYFSTENMPQCQGFKFSNSTFYSFLKARLSEKFVFLDYGQIKFPQTILRSFNI